MKKSKQIFLSSAFIVTFLLANNPAKAKSIYTESTSYADANGCIHILYNVDHQFLGFTVYTSKEDVVVAC